MIHNLMQKQFFLYILVGSFSGVISFCFRVLVNRWVSFSIAIILAYLVGMITAFILAKLFIFKKSQQPLHRTIIIYSVINLLGLLQTLFITLGLAYYILPAMGINSHAREIAHFIGLVSPVYISYLGHKKFSFRHP
jgi:putative flippase GtrA